MTEYGRRGEKWGGGRQDGACGRARYGHRERAKNRMRQREIEMRDGGFCNLTHD